MKTEDTKRYTIVLSAAHQDKLAAVAKQFKISQGEVIEELLDHAAGLESMAERFTARREEKVAGRTSKKELLGKLKSLPAEELAALLAQTGVKA